jgi:NAD(P)-dependent dehydrogenase (short-subunit alcohol dehydrogenase family)
LQLCAQINERWIYLMPEPPRFKIAVITGASAGIGRAAALAFARRGMDIALLSRNKARLESLRAEIEALGRRTLAFPLDVADADAVEAAAAQTEQSLGRGRVPARHRSDVSRHGLRHARGVAPDAGARPRQHRAGWLGVSLPRHSTPVGLLRGEACPAGVQRLAAIFRAHRP